MKLSICIVNWNVKNLLDKCLSSVYKNHPSEDFEVIVIDNASSDGSAKMVSSAYPKATLVTNSVNQGFSKGNNQAIRLSKGEFILLLNPDTEVLPGALDTLVWFLEMNKRAGVAAPKLLNPDGSLQKSCLSFPTVAAMAARQLFVEALWPGNPASRKYLMGDFKYDTTVEVDQPMGAALLIRKEVLDKVGLFDENSFMFFDEVDLCYRIKKAGWKIFFTPAAQITHHGGTSIKKWGALNLSRHWTRSRNLYFKKNYGKTALVLLYLIDLARIAVLLLVLWGIIYLIEFILLLAVGLFSR